MFAYGTLFIHICEYVIDYNMAAEYVVHIWRISTIFLLRQAHVPSEVGHVYKTIHVILQIEEAYRNRNKKHIWYDLFLYFTGKWKHVTLSWHRTHTFTPQCHIMAAIPTHQAGHATLSTRHPVWVPISDRPTTLALQHNLCGAVILGQSPITTHDIKWRM